MSILSLKIVPPVFRCFETKQRKLDGNLCYQSDLSEDEIALIVLYWRALDGNLESISGIKNRCENFLKHFALDNIYTKKNIEEANWWKETLPDGEYERQLAIYKAS